MPATLLLADDSATIQRVVELTFAGEDVRVVGASDGEVATQRIETEPPDIVLADVGMPRRNGYELAAYVKQSPALKHIPVLLLAGAFEPVDEDKARASGCDGILVKPFEPQQLVSRVKELLAGTHPAVLWPDRLPRVELPAPPSPSVAPAAGGPLPTPLPSAPPVAVPRASAPVVPKPVEAAPPVAPKPSPPALPKPVEAAPPAPPPAPPKAVEPLPAPPKAVEPLPAPPKAVERTAAPKPAEAKPAPSQHADWEFQQEMDQLDAAFAELDADTMASLDEATASDFARDLHEFRSGGEQPAGGPAFGDWDLPSPPVQPETPAPEAPTPGAPNAAAAPTPEAPAWDLRAGVEEAEPTAAAEEPAAAAFEPPAPADGGRPVEPEGKSAAPRASLAAAFNALLAAEQSQPIPPPRPVSPALSEAAVEEIVHRVLTRMTDQAVRQVVLETAERLIKEEIAKRRTNP